MKQRVTGKLGNMRRPVNWTVYPQSYNESRSDKEGSPMMVVQSDKRICQFNTETGTGVLSSGKGGHPGFYALSKFLGATDIEVPREFIEQCQANQPQSGDIVGSRSGVVVRVA